LCLMNFSDERKTVLVKDAQKQWEKAIDSSNTPWGGTVEEPELVMLGEDFVVPPESIIIYTCDHV
ncbi:MAG: hypothetical protein ACTHJ8_02330, partial [Mucilaginibacter sp.]